MGIRPLWNDGRSNWFQTGLTWFWTFTTLRKGHDKFAFMERMVTDKSVTHVLVVCDKTYSQKADARKAGVGTESQIISKEVYEKVGSIQVYSDRL